MTYKPCSICHAVIADERPCHYCGAYWVASLRMHIDICTGRQLVRGLYRTSFGAGARIPKSVAAGVASKQARMRVSA